jgi:hypothetical protein
MQFIEDEHVKNWRKNGKPYRSNLGTRRDSPFVKGTRCVANKANGTLKTGPRGGQYYETLSGTKVYCQTEIPAPKPSNAPSQYAKGTILKGYEVVLKKTPGGGKKKVWKRI